NTAGGRFGKDRLGVGYGAARRPARREGATVAAAGAAGHTVVLSRAEIGSILEKEKRQAPAKVVPIPMPETPPATRPAEKSSWPAMVFGFAAGTAFGAGLVWWLLHR